MRKAFPRLRLKFVVWFSYLHGKVLRLSGGRLMHELKGLNMLLLFTKGRHTRKVRQTPLLYIEAGDRYYCAASFAGSNRDPEWYLNLVANPNVELLIRKKRIAAKAHSTEGKERKEAWRKLVEYYPSFATYQERTKRTIPVVRFSFVSDSTKN